MDWKTILPSIILIVVLLGVYNLLKIYVFDKMRTIKWVKWIVLALAVLLGLLNTYVLAKFGESSWQYYLCIGLFVISIFAFFDFLGFGRKSQYSKNNKRDDIVIKPKAKPNRVKHKDTKDK